NLRYHFSVPVSTISAMSPYLIHGVRLVIKDIDFGTIRFSNIDSELQARVFQARERWEQERVDHGYAFEDSWVGSKLAGYLRDAGYQQVKEKSYTIRRHYPLSKDFHFYLQGIAEWFVCEGAHYLSGADVIRWLSCFLAESNKS